MRRSRSNLLNIGLLAIHRGARWGAVLAACATILVAVRLSAQEVLFDFDEEDPTLTEELEDYFQFLGIATTEWRIDENLQNLDDPSQALHITSDGEQDMQAFFSRAAIVHADTFLASNFEFSVDITFDDQGGDANDHAGAYFRFTGESDDPFENEFYYVRIDAASVGDTGSSVNLHRLKNGSQQQVASAGDFPMVIAEGDTVNVRIEAIDEQITVLINDEPVPGMSPYVDADPILACGRVGVGEHTNPAYFDNFLIVNNDDAPCPCVASRGLSTRRYEPGDSVTVTLTTRDTSGTSTLVDTFPDGWTVSDPGGGAVAANEITFTLNGDGQVSYELAPPAGFCGGAGFSGTLQAAGGCQVDVDGDSILVCVDAPPGAVILDFDDEGPLVDGELPDFFDFYGFDNCVGPDPCWNIAANGQDAKDPSRALHTVSDGEQLQNYFSRVAIVKPEVFEAQDIEYSVDLTFDDRGGDANDHAGVYFRFNGESDEPLENEYYFLRIDAGGGSSNINLHRVKDGAEQTLASATDSPFTIAEGDTVTVSVRAEETEISVLVDGVPVPGMDPYFDELDTILGDGRVGVGENTNPAYFDNFTMFAIGEEPRGPLLRPGDVNQDGGVNISDPVAHLNFLFAGGPLTACFTVPGSDPVELSEAGVAVLDFNGDGGSNIADPVGALNFLFGGGNNPGHALGEECAEIPGGCAASCR